MFRYLKILAYLIAFSFPQAHGQEVAIADTSRHPTDSFPGLINKQKGWNSVISPVANLIGTTTTSSLTTGKKMRLSNTGLFKSQYVDTYNNLKKSLQEIPGLVAAHPFRIRSMNAGAILLYDSGYISDNTYSGWREVNAFAEISVANIPLTATYLSQEWQYPFRQHHTVASVVFDPETYIADLKKKLAGKFDPSSLLGGEKSPAERLFDDTKRNLLQELSTYSKSVKQAVLDEIKGLGNISELLSLSPAILRQKYMGQHYINEVKAKERLLNQLQHQYNNGKVLDTLLYRQVKEELSGLEGIAVLIEKFEEQRNHLEKSGLIGKLKELQLLEKKKLEELLNDPATIRKLAKQYLSLPGLSKTFLSIEQLNIGQNVISQNPLSLQHFLSNGISTRFRMNTTSIGLLAGRMKDFNSVLDYYFSDNINSSNGAAKGLTLGMKSSKLSTSQVSVTSFSQSPDAIPGAFAQSDFRQVLVTTLANQFAIGSHAKLDIDISRSAVQYQQVAGGTDSFYSSQSNMDKLLSGSGLNDNTAISFRYADEYPTEGLSYQFMFSKVAAGYENPGNSFLSNGTTEYGLNLRKAFFKNKLQLSFRGRSRLYRYNIQKDNYWQSSSILADAKLKLKKGQFILMRYQPVQMFRHDGGVRSLVNASGRWSAEANLFRRFGKIIYRHYLSMSAQKYSYQAFNAGSNPEKYSSVGINSSQTIIKDDRQLFLNVQFNYGTEQANSVFAFFAPSTFSEIGYSYPLFKGLTASSGILYSSISGWYRQAGFRQTISGEIGERLSVHLYLDARKNLQTSRPIPEPLLRADISIQYNLKQLNR